MGTWLAASQPPWRRPAIPAIAAHATGDVGALNNRTDKRVMKSSLNSAAVVEGRCADQGDHEPGQAGVPFSERHGISDMIRYRTQNS